jgi:Family of unknown function (DUF6152)
MRSLPSLMTVAVGLLIVSAPILAHHGNAEYDEKKPLTLKGTITEFMWASPHSKIFFDVKDSKGTVVHWSIETLSPSKLAREGWTKDAVKPGDLATITFSPAKDGAPLGFLQKVVFPDGKQLGMLEHPQ